MSGRSDFVELKITLRAISTNTSLSILHELAVQGERSVTDLVSTLGFSQPLISWHLRNLRRVGLVCTRRHGRIVYCSLERARFAACQQMLSDLVAPPAESHSQSHGASAALAGQTPASAGGPPDRAGPKSMASSSRSRAGPDAGP